tara:strand:- start:39 stop:332 length:294 start_codon:yes stop_codon:yes gene_type:complete
MAEYRAWDAQRKADENQKNVVASPVVDVVVIAKPKENSRDGRHKILSREFTADYGHYPLGCLGKLKGGKASLTSMSSSWKDFFTDEEFLRQASQLGG